jgi:hypothetical protein
MANRRLPPVLARILGCLLLFRSDVSTRTIVCNKVKTLYVLNAVYG